MKIMGLNVLKACCVPDIMLSDSKALRHLSPMTTLFYYFPIFLMRKLMFREVEQLFVVYKKLYMILYIN